MIVANSVSLAPSSGEAALYRVAPQNEIGDSIAEDLVGREVQELDTILQTPHGKTVFKCLALFADFFQNKALVSEIKRNTHIHLPKNELLELDNIAMGISIRCKLHCPCAVKRIKESIKRTISHFFAGAKEYTFPKDFWIEFTGETPTANPQKMTERITLQRDDSEYFSSLQNKDEESLRKWRQPVTPENPCYAMVVGKDHSLTIALVEAAAEWSDVFKAPSKKLFAAAITMPDQWPDFKHECHFKNRASMALINERIREIAPFLLPGNHQAIAYLDGCASTTARSLKKSLVFTTTKYTEYLLYWVTASGKVASREVDVTRLKGWCLKPLEQDKGEEYDREYPTLALMLQERTGATKALGEQWDKVPAQQKANMLKAVGRRKKEIAIQR